MIFPFGAADEFAQVRDRPASFGNDLLERNRNVGRLLSPLLAECLLHFVDCAKQMLASDFPFEMDVIESSSKNPARISKNHTEEKKSGCCQDDNCSGRHTREQCADRGSEPSAEAANDGRKPEHFFKILGPESCGCRWCYQESDDQNQPDRLQSCDCDEDDEGHHQQVESVDRPAETFCVAFVETEKRKFFQK